MVHVMVAPEEEIDPATTAEITGGLFTLTEMLLEAVLPDVSVATAVRVCEALEAVVVFQDRL